VNKYSVEKALRFNGRVLDKEPIKIKKHPSQNSAIKSNTVSSQSMQLRSHSLIERFDLPPVHSLSSKLWELVVREVKLIEWSEQQKLLLALTLWRMGLLMTEGGLLLSEYKVNLRGQYLLFTLQQEIVDRLQKQAGEIGMEGTSLEITEGKAIMWYTVAYSNIEEGSLYCTIRIKQSLSILTALKVHSKTCHLLPFTGRNLPLSPRMFACLQS
jgi:hypothetical protein